MDGLIMLMGTMYHCTITQNERLGILLSTVTGVLIRPKHERYGVIVIGELGEMEIIDNYSY